ncbi:helix-turn-helix domain-containing protein [Methylobacterium sp. P31]
MQKYEKGRNRIGAGRLQIIADLLKVPVETFFADPQRVEHRAVGAPAFFDDPKLVELILAFTSITDEATRNGVLSIVKGAAALHHSRSRGEPETRGAAD